MLRIRYKYKCSYVGMGYTPQYYMLLCFTKLACIIHCSLLDGMAHFYTTFTRSKNHLNLNLDCNRDPYPEDIPVYTGHSLFNTTKRIPLLSIVHSLLHRNQPNIWIKIIQTTIQIECLHKIWITLLRVNRVLIYQPR